MTFVTGEVDVPGGVDSRPGPPLGRSPRGKVLFVEDFRAPSLGMWNDGVGGASRDTDIMFGGYPSLRLDPQGRTGSGTDPGRTANTSGVVAKRRVQDSFTGKFGLEAWFRFTSKGLTAASYFSMSLYNRDGVNAYHSRVWLDPNGNNLPMHARILDGAATAAAGGTATWFDATTSVNQNGAGSHTFDPVTGSLDKAGGWHYVKLVTDFANSRYVSLQLDGQPQIDLSTYTLDSTASAGAAMMHFSFELFGTTATRRYVNVARVVGTQE